MKWGINMKQIKDFKEGDRIETNLLLTSSVRGVTNAGSPYLSLTFQDASKSIDGKLWDVKPEIEKALETGKVYHFEMEINTYRGALQAKVLSVSPVDENSINMADYVLSSPISKNELANGISDAVNQINNKTLAMIVTALLKKYDNDFYEYPAASKIHHAYFGGLATHTYEMLKLAKVICEVFPQIDKDYLVSGVIIHDLGKIEEYESPYAPEYTKEGKLLGHISILDANLLDVGKMLKLEDSEELLLLRHMVLAHHGEYEYGSPVRPKTLEAEVLNFIDNLDAKVNIIDKALSETKPGEFTNKVKSLEDRPFYKHK